LLLLFVGAAGADVAAAVTAEVGGNGRSPGATRMAPGLASPAPLTNFSLARQSELVVHSTRPRRPTPGAPL
jgi:hypothetical protein